jgi:hypothetical protein
VVATLDAGHDADIHAVTVSDFVNLLFWFQCLEGGVPQHRYCLTDMIYFYF